MGLSRWYCTLVYIFKYLDIGYIRKTLKIISI